MASYTVLFIPDDHARVRRFRVSRRRACWLTGVGSLALLLGAPSGLDWLRARVASGELHALRTENAAKGEQLERLADAVGQLEAELARVQEFERKVRVIADLPTPTEHEVGPPGMGGDDADAALPELSAEEAELPPVGAEAPGRLSSADDAQPRAVRVAGLHARAQLLAEQADERASSLAALVEQLQGKSRRLASTPSIWPARGWITSGFGYRTSPFTGRRQFHAGIDIASEPGTRVLAPARGRVVSAARDGALGLSVVLDHGYGVRTAYGHNSKLLVKKGDEVARGQQIASVGNTGLSTGPHLHYVVQVNGRKVNPLNYVLEE